MNVYAHFNTAKYLAHSLDSQFKVGPFSFGLDPIIDLLPIAGDLITTALSLYIVWIGIEMRIPGDKVAQMIGNVVLDFLLDFIPVLGQVADFAFKSNERNIKILEQYLPADIMEGTVVR